MNTEDKNKGNELFFVRDYILEKLEDETSAELSQRLMVSLSMLSSYKHQGFNPSLNVAMTVYMQEGIALHPFSEESLKFEIKKRLIKEINND